MDSLDELELQASRKKVEDDAELRMTLKKWEMTNPEFSADEFTGRCHWCGVALPGEPESRTHRLLRYARVDIPGVGPLPCLTGFDHEQNEICLHCGNACFVFIFLSFLNITLTLRIDPYLLCVCID